MIISFTRTDSPDERVMPEAGSVVVRLGSHVRSRALRKLVPGARLAETSAGGVAARRRYMRRALADKAVNGAAVSWSGSRSGIGLVAGLFPDPSRGSGPQTSNASVL